MIFKRKPTSKKNDKIPLVVLPMQNRCRMHKKRRDYKDYHGTTKELPANTKDYQQLPATTANYQKSTRDYQRPPVITKEQIKKK